MLAIAEFLQARDDRTILFAFTSIITVNPILHSRLPYDPLRDVLPISPAVDDFIAVAATLWLPANPCLSWSILRERIANSLNYASVPAGAQFGIANFQKMNEIKMTFVRYRNPIASVTDLMERRIQVAIMPLSIVANTAAAGKLKLLAAASNSHYRTSKHPGSSRRSTPLNFWG